VANDFRGWGEAYGVPLSSADGNHVLDMYAATRIAVDRCRAGGGPVFLEATTFRMGGHATHDVAEGRRTFPPGLFEYWGRRDPIGMYEEFLVGAAVELGGDGDTRGTRNRDALHRVEAAVSEEVEGAADAALASRESRMPAGDSAAFGVYHEETA
jgi:pyruvate dehydrogenase E1 component alpha subunit